MKRMPVTPGWYGADPDDPDCLCDPHPALRRLREEHPVNLTPEGHWRLTRYRDVHRLLHAAPAGMRTSSGRLPGQSEEDAVLNPAAFMLLQDPPAHTRLRKLVSKAFTPRAVESWRPRVEAITGELLDAVAARGRMDLIADLALPVPSTLICELMGIPVSDRDTFTSWTTDATHGLATSRNMATPEVEQRVAAAGAALVDYFGRLFEERRRALGDDLLSVLIAAEEAGDRLSATELLAQSIGLLIAGFETTIGLIGNGLTELILHPDEIAKLRERPELIESAVEECLRFAGPIVMTVRVLRDDVEFDGIAIPRDAQVFAVLAAANRDPEQFEDPERFDVERYAREPRPPAHLAFGGGTHHCLGAHLARMESQVAIGSLVQRFDRLALLDERTEWGRSLFRVPARIPVTFRARR
jgi:cytochrome P450